MYDYNSLILGSNIRVKLNLHFWTEEMLNKFADFIINKTTDNLGPKLVFSQFENTSLSEIGFYMTRSVNYRLFFSLYRDFLLQFNLNKILTKEEINFINKQESQSFLINIFLIGNYIKFYFK